MAKPSKAHDNILVYLLVGVLVLQTALIGFLVYQSISLSNSFSRLQRDIGFQFSGNIGLVGDPELPESPEIDKDAGLAVFEQFNFALPYNDITKTLQYYSDFSDNIRVTSTQVKDEKMRQMSCSELVRISFEDGNPYSPWEESAGSVELSDGRTMYIIAAKAFANEEASTLECDSEVWTSIKPIDVANEFKKAVKY